MSDKTTDPRKRIEAAVIGIMGGDPGRFVSGRDLAKILDVVRHGNLLTPATAPQPPIPAQAAPAQNPHEGLPEGGWGGRHPFVNNDPPAEAPAPAAGWDAEAESRNLERQWLGDQDDTRRLMDVARPYLDAAYRYGKADGVGGIACGVAEARQQAADAIADRNDARAKLADAIEKNAALAGELERCGVQLAEATAKAERMAKDLERERERAKDIVSKMREWEDRARRAEAQLAAVPPADAVDAEARGRKALNVILPREWVMLTPRDLEPIIVREITLATERGVRIGEERRRVACVATVNAHLGMWCEVEPRLALRGILATPAFAGPRTEET